MLLQKQVLKLFPHVQGALGGAAEKAAAAPVRSVILLNKAADVDLVFPQSAYKTVPFLPLH